MLSSKKGTSSACQAGITSVCGGVRHTPPACRQTTQQQQQQQQQQQRLLLRASPRESPAVSKTSSSTGSSTGDRPSTSGKSVLDPEFAAGLLEELKDPSQLGQRGEGWTIAQFVAIGLVLLPPFHSSALVTFVGVVLLLGGASAMALGLQDLGAALTPLPMPRKGSELVTTGVYGYMRHPMYGGLIMASLGLAAVSHDESRLLAAAVLWLVLEQKVAFEEKLLAERFGAAYEKYQHAVKKFLPYLY